MKKGKIIWASLIIGTLGITLAACNNEQQPPVEVKEVTISITSTETSVMAGETLQLQATVENAEDTSVSWFSSDTNVATIGQSTGLVTGVKKGKTTITATSNADPTKTATVEIVVVDLTPESITISGYNETTLRSHSTLQLSATASPEDSIQTVNWSTSNEDIATVSETGLVTFIGEGEVIITASSTKNEEVKSTVTFNPYYIVSSWWGNESWDFSGLHGMNPTFKSKNASINQNAVLNNVSGKYYAFEATAKITDPSSSNTWSRVGLGHIPTTQGGRVHSLMLSPGPDFGARKTVVMDVVDQNVQWGITTDRSQVWGQHDLNKIDFNSVKFTSVRNGNDYYYFINDTLYWVEKGFEEFKDLDTFPAFHCADTNVEFSNISVVTGEEAVKGYLDGNSSSKDIFYPTSSDNVLIDKEAGTFKFINCENGITTNAKDQAIKSLGSARLIKNGVTTKISFDFTVDLFGNRDANPGFAITMNRYDSASYEARSVVVCENNIGYTGWNSNGDLNPGIGDIRGTFAEPLKEGSTYHIDFYKISNDSVTTDNKFSCNGIESQWGWNDGYSGNHVLSINVRDMNLTISNLTITEE